MTGLHAAKAVHERWGGSDVTRRDDIVYRRTQIGVAIIAAVGSAVVLLGVLGVLTGGHPVAIAVQALLVAVLGVLCCLTIEIDGRQLRCFFGPGLIRRTISLHDIVAARPVRNRWYYGWGIRLTPSGWMFNVSGLDAVELSLASGARFRIGTDQPDEVVRALAAVTTLAPSAGTRDGGPG